MAIKFHDEVHLRHLLPRGYPMLKSKVPTCQPPRRHCVCQSSPATSSRWFIQCECEQELSDPVRTTYSHYLLVINCSSIVTRSVTFSLSMWLDRLWTGSKFSLTWGVLLRGNFSLILVRLVSVSKMKVATSCSVSRHHFSVWIRWDVIPIRHKQSGACRSGSGSSLEEGGIVMITD